jgi:hypothetical protein
MFTINPTQHGPLLELWSDSHKGQKNPMVVLHLSRFDRPVAEVADIREDSNIIGTNIITTQVITDLQSAYRFIVELQYSHITFVSLNDTCYNRDTIYGVKLTTTDGQPIDIHAKDLAYP